MSVSLGACNRATYKQTAKEATELVGFKSMNEVSEDVTITADQLNRFLNCVSYDEIRCPYSELFGIEEAKQEKNTRVFSVVQHTYNFFDKEKTVDADKLYNVVKSNNEAYLADGVKKNFNKELSESDLKKACVIVADAVNWGIENVAEFDWGRIGCVLANLKILTKNSFSYGIFDEKEHLLTLVPDLIERENEKDDSFDMFEQTVTHETMHMMQCYCVDIAAGAEDSFIGISYDFENLPVNPLKNRWLFEASAELCTSSKMGIPPTTYKSMIKNLETINLSTVLDDAQKAKQTEKISFSNKAENLYNQLEFANQNKAIEFLYVIELLREAPEDFKAVYEKEYGSIDANYSEFLKETYNHYFVETTSKLFYKNLAEKLSSTQMSLDDIFYLISLYEMDLLKDIPLNNTSIREENENIYYGYLALQNEFYTILQENMKTDVKTAFVEYKANYGEEAIYANADLSWLSEDKKEYLLYRNKDLYNKYFKNISSIENNQ